ncbi:ParA family protein [Thermodesulfobacterium sp. TA1]|uniref:ParA family protein n=1 Tax=Thermodesulfobacterium sp. TA1 TaxID=2234087 RepID=UPI001231E57E|nr:AAA family ATPase [Thermodesulfobacterium sp. TA1]QER41510.1 ParA family protein [Thermodesulfobacterium sp. TA1]
MKTLAFINQKGGVGKTTVCVNLARALSLKGFKVLVVDFDPQANASSGLGIRVKKEQSIYQAIVEGDPTPFIKQPFPELYLLPSSIDLVGLEIELVGYSKREYVLKELLEKGNYNHQPIKSFFDFIFIDSPPSLGLITVNILTASEGVVIPLQCEYYALEGLSLLVRTIKGIKKSLNPNLVLFGLVLTMYDSRNRLSHEIAEEAEKHFKWIIFKTKIPRSVKVSEAQSFGKPVLDYDRQNRVSLAFQDLALEFLSRIKEREGLG